jgi:phosphate/sulfate permease
VGTIVLVALAFDVINGFHDAANSIATGSVHPRALAVLGRRLGRVLQLQRGVPVRRRRGQERRAWVLTIPALALVGWISLNIFHLFVPNL